MAQSNKDAAYIPVTNIDHVEVLRGPSSAIYGKDSIGGIINIVLKEPENEVFVGNGFDVHEFEKGRPLILCGEKIDYEFGLKAHSDGDVALHALTDAILGAAGLGDIGELFPDTDAKFKDISSIYLLEEAY